MNIPKLAVHPRFPEYIVPATDVEKKIGAAVDPEVDKLKYARVIARTCKDRHGRHDAQEVAQIIVASVNAYVEANA